MHERHRSCCSARQRPPPVHFLYMFGERARFLHYLAAGNRVLISRGSTEYLQQIKKTDTTYSYRPINWAMVVASWCFQSRIALVEQWDVESCMSQGSNAASSHACAIADPCMGSWTVGPQLARGPSGIRGGTRTSASTARAAVAPCGGREHAWLVISGERASHSRERSRRALVVGCMPDRDEVAGTRLTFLTA
jgi:hypothetical protein